MTVQELLDMLHGQAPDTEVMVLVSYNSAQNQYPLGEVTPEFDDETQAEIVVLTPDFSHG